MPRPQFTIGKDEAIFVTMLAVVIGSAVVSWTGGTINTTVVTSATGILALIVVRNSEKRDDEDKKDDQ